MVTTLCITSLNQGKIAPRYDLESKSVEAAAEEAACKLELEPWHIGHRASAIWKAIFVLSICCAAGSGSISKDWTGFNNE